MGPTVMCTAYLTTITCTGTTSATHVTEAKFAKPAGRGQIVFPRTRTECFQNISVKIIRFLPFLKSLYGI